MKVCQWLRIFCVGISLHVRVISSTITDLISNPITEEHSDPAIVQCQYPAYKCQEIEDTSSREFAVNCYKGATGRGSCYLKCKRGMNNPNCKGYCPEYIAQCSFTATTTLLPKVESTTITPISTTTTTEPIHSGNHGKPRPSADGRENLQIKPDDAGGVGGSIYAPLFFVTLPVFLVVVGILVIYCLYPQTRDWAKDCWTAIISFCSGTPVMPSPGLPITDEGASPKSPPVNGTHLPDQTYSSNPHPQSPRSKGTANDKPDVCLLMNAISDSSNADNNEDGDCERNGLLSTQHDTSTVNSTADLLGMTTQS